MLNQLQIKESYVLRTIVADDVDSIESVWADVDGMTIEVTWIITSDCIKTSAAIQ